MKAISSTIPGLAKDKRMMAIGVVLLLVVSAIVFSATRQMSTGIKDKNGVADMDLVEVLKNIRLTDVPQSNNEPHIAVNPTDPMNIVAGGNDYGTPLEDSWVGVYTSIDGGKNWTRVLIPGYYDMGNPKPGEPLWGYKGGGDPVVAFGPDGTCYVAGIAFKRYPMTPGRSSGIFVARSDDKGFTWEVNMVIASATIGTFHDKEWIAVDQNTGNVYVTWTAFNFYAVSSLVFSKSADGGRTWSRPVAISDLLELELQVQGSAVVVDSSGTIHVVWIDFDSSTVRYTKSSDQGSAWTAPTSIAAVKPLPSSLPGGSYRTPTLMAMAVDMSNGTYGGSLYATWPDYSENNGDILLVYSRDGGENWSDPVKVNNDDSGNDQFFPAITVSPNGWVHMSFYDRRNDPDNVLLSLYYAQSRDGGQNFTIQTNVTEVMFNGDHSRGPFIGDYNGIAANDTVAHMVWCDMRHGTESSPNSEVYYGAVRFL